MVLLESAQIANGTSAPEFNLVGIDGKIYGLENFKDFRVLVLVFMCNHCPYVQAIWGRLVALQEMYMDKSVQFIGINPNIANSDYEEETFEHMKKYAERYKMNFPFLADIDQTVARNYNAQCTPDIFVYDSGRKLVYHGRIDDNWKNEAMVTKKELANAIESLLKGEVPNRQLPSMGCSIKWI